MSEEKAKKKKLSKIVWSKVFSIQLLFQLQTNQLHAWPFIVSPYFVCQSSSSISYITSANLSLPNNPIGYVNATHTQNNNNEWMNERLIRPHNLQKSLNKLPSCTCKQITICCFPKKKHICILIGLLITGCGISNPKYTSGKFILIYSLLNQ